MADQLNPTLVLSTGMLCIKTTLEYKFGNLNLPSLLYRVAPELLDCKPPSTKTDVYAFGMVSPVGFLI